MARHSGSYGGTYGGGTGGRGRYDPGHRGHESGDRGTGGEHGPSRSGGVPGPQAVADFTPVRPGPRGRRGLRRITRGRRRVAAATLAVAAAALSFLVALGGRPGATPAEGRRASGEDPTTSVSGGVERTKAARERMTTDGSAHSKGSGGSRNSTVSAPVRIADAATVRLLKPGDRVDVISSADGERPARVVARAARVDRLPRSLETDPVGAADGGALVVLRVPRGTATALVGAGTAGRLAVTLC